MALFGCGEIQRIGVYPCGGYDVLINADRYWWARYRFANPT